MYMNAPKPMIAKKKSLLARIIRFFMRDVANVAEQMDVPARKQCASSCCTITFINTHYHCACLVCHNQQNFVPQWYYPTLLGRRRSIQPLRARPGAVIYCTER